MKITHSLKRSKILSLLIGMLVFLTFHLSAQMPRSTGKLSIGAYAQVDYNQVINKDFRQNGNLDVHRMVMTMGYKFNKRTYFFTEIEYEHIKEVFVEQAYLRYKINDFINFKAGLMLIPMGIINERHEPNTYNGVERPLIDKTIVPTTWREIGAGFTGRIDDASIKYQVYLVNGFNGYDGSAKFSGQNGLRKGRQKGAKSYISSPNLSAKINYFGLGNLKFGLSTYIGKSQSTLYHGLDKNNASFLATADSSVIGINMLGLDAQYKIKGLQLRGQFIIASISNTNQYNDFTQKDMGSGMMGYYTEIAYNLLNKKAGVMELSPFIRYEEYNTHHTTTGNLVANDAYNKSVITFGLGWKMSKGAVLKMDYQLFNSKASDSARNQFNMGVGISF